MFMVWLHFLPPDQDSVTADKQQKKWSCSRDDKLFDWALKCVRKAGRRKYVKNVL